MQNIVQKDAHGYIYKVNGELQNSGWHTNTEHIRL